MNQSSVISDVPRLSTYCDTVKKQTHETQHQPQTSVHRFVRQSKRKNKQRRMTAIAIEAALILSSGYHTLLRITVQSDIRPTRAAPTVNEDNYGPSKRLKEFTNPCYRHPEVKNRHQLTPRWLCDNVCPCSKLTLRPQLWKKRGLPYKCVRRWNQKYQ